MAVTLDGTEGVATAAPGDVVALNGVTATAACRIGWRAGYDLGALHAGDNEIRSTIWIADRRDEHGRARRVQEIETVARPRRRSPTASSSRRRRSRYVVPPLAHDAVDGARRADRVRPGRLGLAAATPGRTRRAAAEAARQHLHQGDAGRGRRSAWTASAARSSPSGGERQEQAAEPFASAAVPAFDCISAVPAATSVAPVSVDFVRRRGLAPTTRGSRVPLRTVRGATGCRGHTSPRCYSAGLLVEGDNALTGP